MQRDPNLPQIISFRGDTIASDALVRDILDVLKENEWYQLAMLEQQNRLHDSLLELNRSILTDRAERHAVVEELHSQVDGLREDLNLLFDHDHGAERDRFRTTRRTGRRTPRRPRRVQTPRPMRRSPDLVDSTTSAGEGPLDPSIHRRSQGSTTVPIRSTYTPAYPRPGIPSFTTGTTLPSSNNNSSLRPGSQQRSSQGSSGLTYATDDPVIPPPPPGFVPYHPHHRQIPFPAPHVVAPSQQSPLHPAPVVPPSPHFRRPGDRATNESQSD